MGTISETGHYVNLKNFKLVVSYVKGKGVAYQPANTQISLVNLQAKESSVGGALSEYAKKAAEWGKAVNERETVYEPVDAMVTRIRNAAVASENVTEAFLKDVHGIVNEILGVRASPKLKMIPEDSTVPTDESVKQISAAQTGYDNKYGNLVKLANVLGLETNYAPNEDDIKVVALTDLLAKLDAKNQGVINAVPAMEYGRDERDKEMYDEHGGSNLLASKVKAYFKAAYGSNSKDFHHLGKLKFVNLKA